MFLYHVSDLLLFLLAVLSLHVHLIFHLAHIVLDFFHDLHLHLNLHVTFLLSQLVLVWIFRKPPILLHVDDMVLLYLLFGLLGQFLHFHLLIDAQPHHPSDRVPHVSFVVCAIFLKNAYNFGSGKHILDLFHEEESEGMLIGMNILHEFDVEPDHLVQ